MSWKTALIFVCLWIIFLGLCYEAKPEEIWLITAYCPCKVCCGSNAKGITASGHTITERDEQRIVACNWLPFGTRLAIEDIGNVTVMDRGAKSLFGDNNNHIKHLDLLFVGMNAHKRALAWGKRYKQVIFLK